MKIVEPEIVKVKMNRVLRSAISKQKKVKLASAPEIQELIRNSRGKKISEKAKEKVKSIKAKQDASKPRSKQIKTRSALVSGAHGSNEEIAGNVETRNKAKSPETMIETLPNPEPAKPSEPTIQSAIRSCRAYGNHEFD